MKQENRWSLWVTRCPFPHSDIAEFQEDHVRWEAAKTLGAIGDVRSIPALVERTRRQRPRRCMVGCRSIEKIQKDRLAVFNGALVKSKKDSVLLRLVRTCSKK